MQIENRVACKVRLSHDYMKPSLGESANGFSRSIRLHQTIVWQILQWPGEGQLGKLLGCSPSQRSKAHRMAIEWSSTAAMTKPGAMFFLITAVLHKQTKKHEACVGILLRGEGAAAFKSLVACSLLP